MAVYRLEFHCDINADTGADAWRVAKEIRDEVKADGVEVDNVLNEEWEEVPES